MASGNAGNDDLGEACRGFKHDLQDALDHLDDITKSPNLPQNLAGLAEDLGNMLRNVKQFAEKNRFLGLDAESLPKRR
jgi:hypothetical protein